MKKKTIYFLFPIVIAVISISFAISVEADLLKLFTFDTTTETFTSANTVACSEGVNTQSHDGTRGNPAGSLLTDFDRGGGPGNADCDFFWDWIGTWEDLGVPAGDDIDGLDGKFEYRVDGITDVNSWAVGPMELRQSSGGTNCGAEIVTLEFLGPDSTGTQTTWTTVNDIGTQHLATQTSSDNLCIRVSSHVTSDSNNQENEINSFRVVSHYSIFYPCVSVVAVHDFFYQ